MHQRSQWPIQPAMIPCTYIRAAYRLQEEQEALTHFSASLATIARQKTPKTSGQPANILLSCPWHGIEKVWDEHLPAGLPSERAWPLQ